MNLGFGELVIVLIIVIVLFGATRLPALGKGLGEAIRGFKDGMKGDAPPPAPQGTPGDERGFAAGADLEKKELPRDAGGR